MNGEHERSGVESASERKVNARTNGKVEHFRDCNEQNHMFRLTYSLEKKQEELK